MRRFLPKLDWAALVDTARSLGDESLPDEMPSEWSEEMLAALHHVLLEVSVWCLGWAVGCVSEDGLEIEDGEAGEI